MLRLSITLLAVLSALLLSACDASSPTTEDVSADTALFEIGDRYCGSASCSDSEACCGDACVDLTANTSHCGACGVTCAPGSACVDGACQCGESPCTEGQACCDGSCQDIERDPAHCGACGVTCGSDERCISGACVCSGPAGRLEICGNSESCCPSRGCVDLDADPLHCGGCDLLCGPGEQCVDGTCTCGSTQGSAGPACDQYQACCGASPACLPSEAAECDCGGRRCGAGQTCCDLEGSPLCAATWNDVDNCGGCGLACADGQICSGGGCVCAEGRADCNADPSDGCESPLRVDPAHCGACAAACDSGQVCDGGGRCALTCQAGLTTCGDRCVDVASDNTHCGACGVSCGAGEVCSAGACVTSCQVGLTQCGARCIDTQTDVRHCGACDVACPSGFVCDGTGVCALSCQPGLTDCDGICTQLDADRRHCGACGVGCAAGEVCSSGTCAPSCGDSQTLCAGTCVDLTANRQSCGACGQACGPGEICTERACATTCQEGLVSCDGRCMDLASDRRHCGGCGAGCTGQEICRESTCVVACFQGLEVCGDSCVDVASDPNHCGACDRACGPSQACFGGTCCDATDGCSGVVDIQVGYDFTCARTDAGAVYCWGTNARGELGDGTSVTHRSTPSPVLGIDGVSGRAVSLGVGYSHACAALDDGRVLCWGSNSKAQLGRSPATLSHSSTPLSVPVDGTSGIRQVALGTSTSCVLRDDGVVFCWGNIRLVPRPQPTRMALSEGASELVMSNDFVTALTAHGEPLSFTLAEPVCSGAQCTPVEITPTWSGAPLDGVTSVGAGLLNNHFCGLAKSAPNELLCWSASVAGAAVSVTLTPEFDGSTTELRAYHPQCLIRVDGSLGCRRDANTQHTAQLDGCNGDCLPANGVLPVRLEDGQPLTGVAQVSSSQSHTCARLRNGQAMCWGRNAFGQLGNGAASVDDTTVSITLPSPVVDVQMESYTTCALTESDGISCWGSYEPFLEFDSGPAKVPGSEDAIQMAVGEAHVCWLTGSGAVKCWGADWSGQLGDAVGETLLTLADAPVTVSGIDGIAAKAVAVRATYSSNCALLDDGSVRCWGYNGSGEAGDDTYQDYEVPNDLTANFAETVVDIADTSESFCALLSPSNTVVCWGSDGWCTVGSGCGNYGSTPLIAEFGPGDPVVATKLFSGSLPNVCVDTAEGVVCWGINMVTQSVVAALDNWFAPALIDRWQGPVSYIELGDLYACIIDPAGALFCKGNNSYGEIDPNVTASLITTFHQVQGIDGISASAIDVATASYNASYCALLEGGALRCWGDGETNGSEEFIRGFPVSVVGF